MTWPNRRSLNVDMRSLDHLRRNWRALLAAGAALGALALLWATRDGPLQPAPFVRVDALSAFFSFALLGGAALVAFGQLGGGGPIGWHAPAAVALLLAAWSTTLMPAIAGIYLLVALLMLGMGGRRLTLRLRGPRAGRGAGQATGDNDTAGERIPGGLGGAARRVWGAIRRGLQAAPNIVAAGALMLGYGALAARGALRYDARTAGAALDGFAFWFVLLATIIPISDFRFQILDLRTAPQSKITVLDILRVAWLYPLARLYSLGPWNTGWAFATLLLGGGAALWAALAALTRPADRRDLAPRCFLGLALAGLGLSTGAGIAAGCYGVLAYLVLVSPTATAAPKNKEQRTENKELIVEEPRTTDHGPQTTDTQPPNGYPTRNHPMGTRHATLPFHWLLSGAIPLTAPFVAAWMLVGASVAGGVVLLAGAAWLVVLLSGLTVALDGTPAADRRALLVAAGASVVLGVGAPLITAALIQPLIEQLQGGLIPYGDVNIWPWVGLATIDAAHTPVTTLPSIAVAALMLVLSALVYLVARLRGAWAPEAAQADAPAPGLRTLLASLRDEVPWLGTLASRPANEEPRVDGE
jgi:hypothetical protein